MRSASVLAASAGAASASRDRGGRYVRGRRRLRGVDSRRRNLVTDIARGERGDHRRRRLCGGRRRNACRWRRRNILCRRRRNFCSRRGRHTCDSRRRIRLFVGLILRRGSCRRALRDRQPLLGEVPAFAHRGPLGAVVPMLSLRRDAAGRLQARVGRRRMACRRERDCRHAHRDSGDQMQRASCLFLHELPRDWPRCPAQPSRNVFADSGRSAPRM